jgi:glycine cleavage system H protein
VGPTAVRLPALGAKVAQGEIAIGLEAEGGSAPMLSPVDGTVVAVNPAVKESAAALADSYGAGWLFKVKAPRLAANLRQLHASGPANRMVEEEAAALVAKMRPEVGQVLQDGGTPVNGIAREVAGEEWPKLAREYFRT